MVVIEKSVVETRDGYVQLLGGSPERSTDHLANLSVADALRTKARTGQVSAPPACPAQLHFSTRSCSRLLD